MKTIVRTLVACSCLAFALFELAVVIGIAVFAFVKLFGG